MGPEVGSERLFLPDLILEVAGSDGADRGCVVSDLVVVIKRKRRDGGDD